MTQPVLVEKVDSLFGCYEVRWMCEPPAEHVPHRVTHEEWSGPDYEVRTIYDWELARGPQEKEGISER